MKNVYSFLMILLLSVSASYANDEPLDTDEKAEVSNVSGTQGSVVGRVCDSNNQGVSGVVVRNERGNSFTTTDSDGIFVLGNIKAGDIIIFSYPGLIFAKFRVVNSVNGKFYLEKI